MKRKLLLAGVPTLVLGSTVPLVSIIIGPLMIPLVSNERRYIPHSEIADRFYQVDYPVILSATQRAEFQFSSSQPVNFYIFDLGNWDWYAQNQTTSVITSSKSTEGFEKEWIDFSGCVRPDMLIPIRPFKGG